MTHHCSGSLLGRGADVCRGDQNHVPRAKISGILANSQESGCFVIGGTADSCSSQTSDLPGCQEVGGRIDEDRVPGFVIRVGITLSHHVAHTSPNKESTRHLAAGGLAPAVRVSQSAPLGLIGSLFPYRNSMTGPWHRSGDPCLDLIHLLPREGGGYSRGASGRTMRAMLRDARLD